MVKILKVRFRQYLSWPVFCWQVYVRLLTGDRHRGEFQPHFDGRKFHNQTPINRWATDVFKWLFNRQASPWPKWVEEDPGPTPPKRVDGKKIRACYVNHATVLVQTAGLNIITDPVWSKRVGPFSWLGAKRVHPPGLQIDQLPPIDIILLSHDHYDHLDAPTIQKLMKRDNPKLFTGLGVDRTLLHNGIRGGIAMDWWQEHKFNDDVKIIFAPTQHFSGRGLRDQNSTLWGSFVLDTPGGRIYFAGDSGYASHYKQVQERIGSIKLALIPIGAYEPRWFMGSYHMAPEEAVQAHLDLEAEQSIGIHFRTFRLSDESYDAPVETLNRNLADRGINPKSFQALDFGAFLEV
jgi:L-ascorbate metabolism protein UlaG (beta-lactamase superfamily)